MRFFSQKSGFFFQALKLETFFSGLESNRVFFTVQDTGIGIPAAEKDRIFERFYRIDKSRSKQNGGTGLGLSIVKHAAKYHDASILVNSEVGKGSTFTVIFPM